MSFFAKLSTRLGSGFYLKSLSYTLAVWVVHIILRVFLLFRNDAFGLPFVSKPDWYIFHALCLDYVWIFILSLPLFLSALLSQDGEGRFFQRVLVFYIFLHSLLFMGTIIDQETYRLLGGHLSFNLLTTYGNGASIREVFGFMTQDRSVRYLPYALFLGSMPAAALLYLVFRRLIQSGKRLTVIMIIFGLVAWLFPHYIWSGGFRNRKLTPLVTLIYKELTEKKEMKLSLQDFKKLSLLYQADWILEEGDSSWVFPADSLPYVRVPESQYCKNDSGRSMERCREDRDGDSYNAAVDCNDNNSAVYPGAPEITSNGLDEDCSGLDSLPWNFVLVILESHRALNAGFLAPYGATAAGTPFLDSLAGLSQVWTRFSNSGIPTIAALMATHLSIFEHPTRNIATAFPTLGNKSFSAILGEKGYKTRFFSSADPAWDNQIPWLRQWYQGYFYDRSREDDADMFAHMARWMRDSLSAAQPFLVTAMTKVNHYPFNAVSGMAPHRREDGLLTRMLKTMSYTESELRHLVEAVKEEPWFSRTVFIILGDHGFPLGEHTSASLGWGLYSESSWIPLVMYGSHPMLGPPAIRQVPGDQTDLGPTILEMAGIRQANSFMGHSLLRAGADSLNTAMSLNQEQGLIEAGRYRVHTGVGTVPRIQGDEMFDGILDRTEGNDVRLQHQDLFDSLKARIRTQALLNEYIVENNKVWIPERLEK